MNTATHVPAPARTTGEESRPQHLPWLAAAKTGWAARQGNRRVGEACYECGGPLDSCHGCGDARCLRCEPYLSDDCRWTI